MGLEKQLVTITILIQKLSSVTSSSSFMPPDNDNVFPESLLNPISCLTTGSPHFTTLSQAVKLTMQAESMQSDLNNQWGKLQLLHDLQNFLSNY